MSRHQNIDQTHDTKVANGFFESVAVFKYEHLETTQAHRNWIHMDIKSSSIREMLLLFGSQFCVFSSTVWISKVKIKFSMRLINYSHAMKTCEGMEV
jgi:hypothetical protein